MMKKQNRWSKDDKDLLMEWRKENKSIDLPYTEPLGELHGLFPGRTWGAIYQKMRIMDTKLSENPISNIKKGKSWTNEEKQKLINWMKNNQNTKITWAPIQELINMFPGRSYNSIYCMAYDMKKRKRSRKEIKMLVKRNECYLDLDIVSVINSAVNKYINDCVSMKIAHSSCEKCLQKDNEISELKQMLRKLTPLREALEKCQSVI